MKEEYFDESVSDEDGYPKLNLKDCDDDEQKRQRVQSFFEGMGW